MAAPSGAGAATPAAIDAEILAELAGIGCTHEEAAAWFGVPTAALRRALRDPALKQAWAQGTLRGRVRIRQSQFALAERNATMAGLLGRVMLGQGSDGQIAGARLAEIVDTGIDRED